MIKETGFLQKFKAKFGVDSANYNKSDVNNELEEKVHSEKDYKQRINKLEKLLQAKENSIKTFITKNDTLTSDLLQMKEHLFEKDLALKSVNESLEAVMDRCNFKTKQFHEVTEANENLDDENRALKSDISISKRKMKDIESELQDYIRLNDENNDVINNLKQIVKRREEEILEVQREYEDRVDREKESVQSIRKKAERSSNEAVEVQDQLKKFREKMEKEKTKMFDEVQDLEKVRSDLSNKIKSLEIQLKRAKEENLNSSNSLSFSQSELHATQLKLNGISKENSQLRDTTELLEKKISTVSGQLKTTEKDLENLRIDNETLSQQKTSLASRVTSLQRELEDERDRTTKGCQMIDDYKRQVSQYQSELSMLNSKSEELVKNTMEEEQEIRRKWQQRLQESEDELTRLTAKLKVSEKSRLDQGTELEQVAFDYSQLKKNYDTLEKRYSQNESHITEQLLIDQENNDRIESMKRRLNDYTNQINNLKQEKEEELSTSRELRLKIKSLMEKIDDMEQGQETEERKRLELVRQLNKLQEQNSNLQATVSELECDLERANSKADKSHKELLAVMEKETLSISEKDEEIEIVKKTCRGTINLLKQQLENSEQELNKLNLVKKELEQEILLIQGDLDEAEATVNELNNEIPRQQDILEQLNISLGEVSARCEALQEALVRADTKCVQLQARNEELEDEVKKEESSRRLLEQDSIDLTNKINEQKSKTEGLLDTLGKIESQLEEQTATTEALEQEKGDWILEKRKMRELITVLEADNLHLEETKTALESAESKLKSRIQSILADNDESLTSLRQSNRTKTRVLENRIAELEGQLEEETATRTETEKGLKKLERILKEMEIQAQEDTKAIERQLEQINTLTTRNKQLKTHCGEQESRVNSLQTKLRKLTAEVEESECRAATMSKMLSTPASSRANTPSLRQSAMLRGSSMSRPTSRLISPEVEHILLSGRNSPVGPLATQNTGLIRPGSGFSFTPDFNGVAEDHVLANGHVTPPPVVINEEEEQEGIQKPPELEQPPSDSTSTSAMAGEC